MRPSPGRHQIPPHRLRRPAAALAVLTAVGTLGMIVLEGLGFVDALYFTVATLATVGFGDLVPHTVAGRLFVTALVGIGVGLALYLLSVIAGDVMEGRLLGEYQRARRAKLIEALEGHVIVCGFGRFGQVVTEELLGGGRAVVVVESDVEREPSLAQSGAAYVIGDATTDEVLAQAGIERANALVVALSSAADAVFIVLSAKEMNPGMTVHARAETEGAIRRMRGAGVDRIVSPFQMGGVRLAASVLNPSVVDFLELSLKQRSGSLGMEEVRVAEGSALAGCSVRQIEEDHPRLRIVARKPVGRAVELVIEPTEEIAPGDYLVVIGESTLLKQLALDATGSH